MAPKPSLSPAAIAWLHQCSFSDMTKPPTPEVVAELSKYRPRSAVRLYRFEATPETARLKKLRSFTYEQGMVEFMAETDEQQGGHGEIVVEMVYPSRILVDMTKLPSAIKEGLLNEVIVSRAR
jgi:hypothetical protein